MQLVIDTSTKQVIAAVIDGGRILWQADIPAVLQGASEILPQMQTAIAAGKWSLEDIQEVVIGIGPGSYTGLRVGMAIAKMFAFAKKLPLSGISSLKGLVSEKEGLFAVVVDARSGGAYILKGKKTSASNVEWYSEPQRVAWENVAAYLTGYSLWITPDKTSLMFSLQERLPFEQRAALVSVNILETCVSPVWIAAQVSQATYDYQIVSLQYT